MTVGQWRAASRLVQAPPPASLSFFMGGLRLRAPGAGHHCAENTAAAVGLFLRQLRSSDRELYFLAVCACACPYTYVHAYFCVFVCELIWTSCVQRCGGAEMGMRWPSTPTTCPGLSADHPDFRLQGLCSSLWAWEISRLISADMILIVVIIIMFVVWIAAQFIIGFLLYSVLRSGARWRRCETKHSCTVKSERFIFENLSKTFICNLNGVRQGKCICIVD